MFSLVSELWLEGDFRGLESLESARGILVGTGRFDGAERGCAALLARLLFAPPLRCGDKFWGARDRQSRERCGLQRLAGPETNGRDGQI